MAFLVGGYSDDRFQQTVNEDLHCPICDDVLREAVHCGPNEHYFCRSCIATHLKTSQTCPNCRDDLSVATLKPASRFVANRLNQLIISCENADRGCEERLRLGALNEHVSLKCGFSPAQCPNEGCVSVVNKNDYERHVKRECDFRKPCPDCVELKEELGEVKTKLEERCLELEEVKIKLEERCLDSAKLREDLGEVKTKLEERCLESEQVKTRLEERCQDSVKLREELVEMNAKLEEVMEKLRNADEQQQTVRQAAVPPQRQDFIIMGGSRVGNQPLDCVDMFHWSTMTWERLQPLEKARFRASAFVYKSEVIIAGGSVLDRGKLSPWNQLEKITLTRPESAAMWLGHGITLPVRISAHKCLVYKDHLLLIGGYNSKDGDYNDAIYDIRLNQPFSPRVVARMPFPRRYFGAEIFDDRVMIIGGLETSFMNICLRTVTEYNVMTNTFQDRPPLPFPVTNMATVAWQDKLVVLGGMDEASQTLDTVIQYDVRSGQSTMLPRMIERRVHASAVVTGDVIVVIGGACETGRLRSAEFFSFSTYTWQELPPMNVARLYASAVVKPE